MKSWKGRLRGWCPNCGAATFGETMSEGKTKTGKRLVCVQCGDELKPLENLSPEEKAMVEMQDWLASICKAGKNGPSPQQAATQLGCHRSMVDRLVGMGVLEKSEFSFKGQKLIIISQRSIDAAEKNRKETGNWTGHPVRRGA